MTAAEFELGEQILFTRTLHRHSRWDDKKEATVKRWDPFLYVGEPEPEPRRGIIVGARTLSNGESHYIGYEEGSEWRGSFHFTAYIVAYALRRAHVYVLPEYLRHLDRSELL